MDVVGECERCVKLTDAQAAIDQAHQRIGYRGLTYEQVMWEDHMFCYLRIFKPEFRKKAVIEFGPDPSIAKLVSANREWLDYSGLRSMCVSRVYGDTYHFGWGKQSAMKLLEEYGLRDGGVCANTAFEYGYTIDYNVTVHKLSCPSDERIQFDQEVFNIFLTDQEVKVGSCTTDCALNGGYGQILAVSSVAKVDLSLYMEPVATDGYCYMAAVAPNKRVELARSLGKYPTVQQLILYCVQFESVMVELYQTLAHVIVEASVTSVPLSQCAPDVLVGGNETEIVQDHFKQLRRVASGVRTDDLIVWVPSGFPGGPKGKANPDRFQKQLVGSQAIVSGLPTTSSPFEFFGRVSVKASGWNVLCVPGSVVVAANGVEYQGRNGFLYILYEGALDVQLIVKPLKGEKIKYDHSLLVNLSSLDTDLANILAHMNLVSSIERTSELCGLHGMVLKCPDNVAAEYVGKERMHLTKLERGKDVTLASWASDPDISSSMRRLLVYNWSVITSYNHDHGYDLVLWDSIVVRSPHVKLGLFASNLCLDAVPNFTASNPLKRGVAPDDAQWYLDTMYFTQQATSVE